jgi:integrase
MRLTDAAAAKLAVPPDKSEVFLWESGGVPGFGVRLRAGGRANWVFQYRIARSTRRISIGLVTAIKASDARATASRLYAQIKLGGDPSATKKAARAAHAETLEAAIDIYLARQRQRLRERSLAETVRHLNVHARPLHALPLVKIDRRAIAALVAKLGASSGPVAANGVLKDLAALFAWAMREGLADMNPAAGANRFPQIARSRVLSDDELRAIWQATGNGGRHATIVRLLALTGCRREEIGGLSWSEIDLDKAVISLPSERTKNAMPFDVPLSPAAVDILRAWPRGEDGAVFAKYATWSTDKTLLDQRSGVTGWVLHDIRRSVATGMADIGVQPHVIEAVLNHQSGAKRGVAGIYNRSTYANEKRQAVDRWADHLLALVEGRESKVVALAGRAQ